MFEKILDFIKIPLVKRLYVTFTTITTLVSLIYSIKKDDQIWEITYIVATYFFVFISCVVSAIIIYKSNKLTEAKNQEINSLNNKICDLQKVIKQRNKEIVSISERFKKLSKRNFSDLLSSELTDSSKTEKEILSKGKHYGIASILSHLHRTVIDITKATATHYERLYILSNDLNVESGKCNKNLDDIQYYLFYTGEESFHIDEQSINKLREVSSLSERKRELIKTLSSGYDESDNSLVAPLYSKYGDIFEVYGFLVISFDNIDTIESRELIENITIVIAYYLSYYICRLLNNVRNKNLFNNSKDILHMTYQYISQTEEDQNGKAKIS